jgi:hypothetical protein
LQVGISPKLIEDTKLYLAPLTQYILPNVFWYSGSYADSK